MYRNLSNFTFSRNRLAAQYLRLAAACIFALSLICQVSFAEDCDRCTATTFPQDPLPTGEWLLTKQVNEVNVLFIAAHKGKPVTGLSQSDIVVRDDGKPPKAILGFRNEQALPLRVGVAIDTSDSVTSRFRFEQAAASAFFRQAIRRDVDLGFVMGFENHPTVTQDFASDPERLSEGVDKLTIGGGDCSLRRCAYRLQEIAAPFRG